MQSDAPAAPSAPEKMNQANLRIALFGADSTVLCRTAIYLHASDYNVIGAVTRTSPHGVGKRRQLLHMIERVSRKLISLFEPFHSFPYVEPYRFPTLTTVARMIPGFERVIVEKHNDPEVVTWLQEKKIDIVLLLGTGIIKEPVLNAVRIGVLNGHSALLPKYRGSKSEFWMMLNQDFSALGVTIHWVTPGLDQGRILVQKPVSFVPGDTPESLREKTNELKPMLFDEALRKIASGDGEGVLQDESQATHYSRPTPEDVERLKKLYS